MRRSRIMRGMVALLLLAAGAAAQATHKDTKVGFTFKPPKNYKAIALSPGDSLTAAKYQSDQTEYGGEQGNEGFNRIFEIDFWPIGSLRGDDEGAADAEAKDGEAATPRDEADVARELEDWWMDFLDKRFGYPDLEKDRPLTVDGAEGREIQFHNKQQPLKTYIVMLPQADGVFVMQGTAIDTRFDKAVQDFSKAARSFKRIERVNDDARRSELSQMSEQERFLQQQIDKLPPGWSHLRTTRYLFLYNCEENFVEEMSRQIEGMRNEYERLYPPDRPITDVSIVRVCATFEEFSGYSGAGPGTGGYWNWRARELVFYDQAPRTETLCVLNHEAFHQYIFYFYGQLSPHSWYNEGHGDYFSGAKLTKTYRITGYGSAPGGFDRSGLVREMALATRQGKGPAQGGLAPLKKLLNFSQAEYYAQDDELRPVAYYPQGWAFVHMLRESKGLEPKWQRILTDYLKALLAARHEVAVEVMNKERAAAEKNEAGSSADMSQKPEDWYDDVDEDKVQKRAYEITFKDWTDDDWARLDAALLAYIEKL